MMFTVRAEAELVYDTVVFENVPLGEREGTRERRKREKENEENKKMVRIENRVGDRRNT